MSQDLRCGLLVAFLLAIFARSVRAEDVTVKGTKARDRTAAVTVVPERDLSAPGLTAADILRRQPGTWVTETGGYGSLSTAQVRGATAAQLPVYLGPIRLNDDLGGTADLSLVPLWMVDHVEIYRGHAPASVDEPGVAGALLFEPRRPKESSWAIGGGMGSFHAREIHGRAAFGDARASALAGLRVEGARNDYTYVDDGGTTLSGGPQRTAIRSNADAATVDLWALATAAPTARSRVDLLVNALTREHGVPGLALVPALRARASETRSFLAATGRIPCGSSDTCTISTTSSVHRAGSDYFDPDRELALGAERARVRADRFEQMAILRADASPRLHLSLLARAGTEALETAGAERRLSHRTFARGVAAIGWDATGDLALHAHVNATCNATDSASGVAVDASPLCRNDAPSARAGATLHTGPVSWMLNLGRYTRVPALGELYGLSGVVRGNGLLRPEGGLTVDVGARGAHKALSLEVFAYARMTDDLVAYRKTTFAYVSPYNVGRARALGAEAELTWTPTKEIDLTLPVSVLDARDTSPDRTLVNDVIPFRARLLASPRVVVRPPALGVLGFDANDLHAIYTYQSSRYADPAGLVVIPSQGTLDLELEILALQKHVAARARASNVTGERRFDVVGYPLPGRAFFASMEATF